MEFLARAPKGVFIPTKILAKFHGIPKEYLSKALQQLASSGLIEGTLGPRGGYQLSKAPSEISLLEIVESIEGKKRTFNCQEIRFNNPCLKKKDKDRSVKCAIASAMLEADEAWRRVLEDKKLSEIVTDINSQVPAEIFEKAEEWVNEEMS
ncbi:transcriptional regulator [Bacteriovorax sp. Seq25_V]|nr:transcriptional regulator [Bacteriovorax sp. Seq25_V]